MYAIHETLLPASAIHHSLYLHHFTPSTIYDPPRPSSSRVQLAPQNVRIIGNLVVAGGSDLRVFEISEGRVPQLVEADDEVPDGAQDDAAMVGDVGDSFFAGPSKRAPVAFRTVRKLHLVASHQIHGTITGLAPLRTMESAVDGLDRLLVSIKDAKMAILEWSAGDIATVSLHTYERCQQMLAGDLSVYVPILRTDPLSRLAVLTLPDDSLAVLPILQEQSELDPLEAYPRDLPYSPSYVLALSENFPIKNLRDLLFLPGFHTPTMAMLFSPHHTWAGRYGSTRDTFCLEIRTFDSSAGYPLLTSVQNLPSDSLYMVAAPASMGGVVIVTETGIVHVDQGGRISAAGVNGWWRHVTRLPHDDRSEGRLLSLESSRAAFVGNEMLLFLANGSTHQVRFEMDGRAVGGILVEDELAVVPPPSDICATAETLFVATAEGDSWLYNVEYVRDSQAEDTKPDVDMEADDEDDDLYADAKPVQGNGITAVPSGPARVALHPSDVLSGTGKITDIEFGIAATDEGVRTYPQLVAIGGGTRRSTFNVFRRGIPINKRRRFNELSTAERVWFLPIQRAAGQRLRDIPDDERTTLLLSSEGTQTRVFALANKTNPEQIGRLPMSTVNAAPFFHRTHVLHVHARGVALLDSNGKHVQDVYTAQGAGIVSASICDPYAAVRLADGRAVLLIGDSEGRSVSQQAIPDTDENLCVQSIEVFADETGLYRTFEPSSPSAPSAINGTSHDPGFSHSSVPGPAPAPGTHKTQLSAAQLSQLQHDLPAISTAQPTAEEAVHASTGTPWLALLTTSGELQIRSLPDGAVVFRSAGLASADPNFTDGDGEEGDGAGSGAAPGALQGLAGEEEGEVDGVRQMMFHTLGKGDEVRPHLLVLHNSGRLNIYAALARFTLSAQLARRSLALRFKKVHTQLLPSSSAATAAAAAAAAAVHAQANGAGANGVTPAPAPAPLGYTMHPFTRLEGLTGVFVTGDKPQWIVGDEKHPVRSYGLKQAAYTFGATTHLGGRGEYFVRIEDGTFICYLPPALNTDFAIPCDRYEMERVYTNVAFDPPSAHYVGASVITVPFQAYDEEGEPAFGPEGPTLTPPTNERSTLELFSQGSDPWRVIDGYDFDQNEVVLALQSVSLESESMDGGHRDFIAVGTGFDFAEDRATRGNTYIFEVVQTVGNDPKISGWALKLRTKDPARNPVSALGNINGYLLNSNGPKMYAKGLDRDERLMGLAFLDINLYATSIRTFKNFIVVGDLTKSVWFISFQEFPYKLVTISKDLQEVHTITSDFLVHDGQVAFLSTDRHGDMRMLEFDPADPDSYRGERLMLRTEFHMGAPVTASKTIARRRAPEEEYAPQTQLVYSTANGALTSVVAVKPARFKRLQLVAEQLTRNAQHVAGANPKPFRIVRNDLLPKPLSRGILDGQLLSHFALQPVQRQREMMRQIGTDEVTVASDLQALGGFW